MLEIIFYGLVIWFILLIMIMPIGIIIKQDKKGLKYPSHINLVKKILISFIITCVITPPTVFFVHSIIVTHS